MTLKKSYVVGPTLLYLQTYCTTRQHVDSPYFFAVFSSRALQIDGCSQLSIYFSLLLVDDVGLQRPTLFNV